jgi:hypothetical protein
MHIDEKGLLYLFINFDNTKKAEKSRLEEKTHVNKYPGFSRWGHFLTDTKN